MNQPRVTAPKSQPELARQPETSGTAEHNLPVGYESAADIEFHRKQAVVIAIGVDQFQHPGFENLANAVADAKAVYDILVSQHGFRDRKAFLKNSHVTLAAVRELFSTLKSNIDKGEPINRLLVYVASHGRMAIPENDIPIPRFEIAMANSSLTDGQNFLSGTELQSLVRSLDATHTLLVLDCCFSGAMHHHVRRGVEIGSRSPLYASRWKWFQETSSYDVLTSTAHNQEAMDSFSQFGTRFKWGESEHSPFGHAFIDALSGNAERCSDGVMLGTDIYVHILHLFSEFARSCSGLSRPQFFHGSEEKFAEFVLLRSQTQPKIRSDDNTVKLIAENNPYKGFNSYTYADRRRFYGREDACASVLRLLTGSGSDSTKQAASFPHFMTLIAGESGAGKSSFLHAGLIPALRATPDIELIIPYDSSPRQALSEGALGLSDEVIARAVHKAVREGAGRTAESNHVSDEADWVQALGQYCAQHADRRIVLCLDPLEELLRDKKLNGASGLKQRLTALLQHCQHAGPRNLHVLACMRSDDAQSVDLSSILREHLVVCRLPQPSETELRKIIEDPAFERHVFFEPGVANRIIRDVINMDGVLPWLSYILSQLYLSLVTRSIKQGAATPIRRYITFDDYDHVMSLKTENTFQEDAQKRDCYEGLLLRLVLPGQDRLLRRKERRYFYLDGRRHWATHRRPASSAPEFAALVEQVCGALVDIHRFLKTDDLSASSGEQTKLMRADGGVMELTHDILLHRLGVGELISKIDPDPKQGVVVHAEYHRLLQAVEKSEPTILGLVQRMFVQLGWVFNGHFRRYFSFRDKPQRFLFTPKERRYIFNCYALFVSVSVVVLSLLVGLLVFWIGWTKSIQAGEQEAKRHASEIGRVNFQLTKLNDKLIKESNEKTEVIGQRDQTLKKLDKATDTLKQKVDELSNANIRIKSESARKEELLYQSYVNSAREWIDAKNERKALEILARGIAEGSDLPAQDYLLAQQLQAVPGYRALRLGNERKIRSVLLHPERHMLLLVGDDQLALHHSLLGQDFSLYQLGSIARAALRPDGRVLAILTTQGKVQLYGVEERVLRVLGDLAFDPPKNMKAEAAGATIPGWPKSPADSSPLGREAGWFGFSLSGKRLWLAGPLGMVLWSDLDVEPQALAKDLAERPQPRWHELTSGVMAWQQQAEDLWGLTRPTAGEESFLLLCHGTCTKYGVSETREPAELPKLLTASQGWVSRWYEEGREQPPSLYVWDGEHGPAKAERHKLPLSVLPEEIPLLLPNSTADLLLLSGSASEARVFKLEHMGRSEFVREAPILVAQPGTVLDAAWAPSGEQLLLTTKDGAVKVWQRDAWSAPKWVLPHPLPPSIGKAPLRAQWSHDGASVFSYWPGDTEVRFWRLQEKQLPPIDLGSQWPLQAGLLHDSKVGNWRSVPEDLDVDDLKGTRNLPLGPTIKPVEQSCQRLAAFSLGGPEVAGRPAAPLAWTLANAEHREFGPAALHRYLLTTGERASESQYPAMLTSDDLDWIDVSESGKASVGKHRNGLRFQVYRPGRDLVPRPFDDAGDAALEEVKVSPDGRWLVTATKGDMPGRRSEELTLWDLRIDKPAPLPKKVTVPELQAIRFAFGGNALVTLSRPARPADRTAAQPPQLRLFRLSSQGIQEGQTLYTGGHPIADFAVHPTDRRLLVVYDQTAGPTRIQPPANNRTTRSQAAVVALYSLEESAARLSEFDPRKGDEVATALSFSRDGNRAFIGMSSGQVVVWDFEMKVDLSRLEAARHGQGDVGRICSLTTSHDDSLLVAETSQRSLQAWRLPDVRAITEHRAQANEQLQTLLSISKLSTQNNSQSTPARLLEGGAELSLPLHEQTSGHARNLLASGLSASVASLHALSQQHCRLAADIADLRQEAGPQVHARVCLLGGYKNRKLANKKDEEDLKATKEDLKQRAIQHIWAELATLQPQRGVRHLRSSAIRALEQGCVIWMTPERLPLWSAATKEIKGICEDAMTDVEKSPPAEAKQNSSAKAGKSR